VIDVRKSARITPLPQEFEPRDRIHDGRYNINVLLFRCARCVGGALWGGVWIAVRWGYRYDPPPRGAVAGAPAAMSQGHVHTGIRAG